MRTFIAAITIVLAASTAWAQQFTTEETIARVAEVSVWNDTAIGWRSFVVSLTFKFWTKKKDLAGAITDGGTGQAAGDSDPRGELRFVEVKGARITFESASKADYTCTMVTPDRIECDSKKLRTDGMARVKHVLTPAEESAYASPKKGSSLDPARPSPMDAKARVVLLNPVEICAQDGLAFDATLEPQGDCSAAIPRVSSADLGSTLEQWHADAACAQSGGKYEWGTGRCPLWDPPQQGGS